MSEELKNCPFCGVSMHIESTPHWLLLVGDHTQTCVFMGTRTTMIASASDDQHLAQVVSDWNRRATLSPAHIEGEREAFDCWFRREDGLPESADTTNISAAYLPWKAWKARAALSSPPAAGVPEGIPALASFVAFADKLKLNLRDRDDIWDGAMALYRQLTAAPTPPACEQQRPAVMPEGFREAMRKAASSWLYENDPQGLDWCDPRNVDALLDALFEAVPQLQLAKAEDKSHG